MASPFSANATHSTYFGFSCFWENGEQPLSRQRSQETAAITSCGFLPYLEQALPLAERVSLHGPEVDVRLSTGDDDVGVHGMKHGGQYGVIGALQETQSGGTGNGSRTQTSGYCTFTSASCFSFCQFQTDRM